MAKRKMAKAQTTTNKTRHRQLKIEQHKKPGGGLRGIVIVYSSNTHPQIIDNTNECM